MNRKNSFRQARFAVSCAALLMSESIAQAQTTVYPNSSTDALKRAFHFGWSVSAEGNYLAVGDNEALSLDQGKHFVAGSGEVTLFLKQSNGTWQFKQRLKPRRLQDDIDYCNPGAFTFDETQNRELKYGNTVILKNDLLLVAAPRARKLINGGNSSTDGAVYVYKRNTGTGNFDPFQPSTEVADSLNGTFFSEMGLKFNGRYIAVNTGRTKSVAYTRLYRYDGSNIVKVKRYSNVVSAAITANDILAVNNETSISFEKLVNNTRTAVKVPDVFAKLSDKTFEMLEADGSTVVASIKTSFGTRSLRFFVFVGDVFSESYDVAFPFNANEDITPSEGSNNAGRISFKEGKTLYVAATGGVLQFNFNTALNQFQYTTKIANGSAEGQLNNISISNTELIIGSKNVAVFPKLKSSEEFCPASTSTSVNQHGAASIFAVTSPCIDNFEPNDISNNATLLSLNSTVFAGIKSNGEKDYFKITLTQPGKIKLLLSNLPADYNLALYDQFGGLKGESKNTGTADELLTTDQPAGTYVIYVYGQNGVFSTSACYKLNNTVSNSCSNNFEPNEDIASASSFSLGSSLQGSIATMGDQDVFKLVVNSRGNLNLSLTNVLFDIDLELLNSTGKKIASSTQGGTSNEAITGFYLVPGTYYAKVFGYNPTQSNISCYTLSNTFAPGNCSDNNEPNNSISGTKRLFNDNLAYTTGNITLPGDEDWFTFVTSSLNGTNVQLTLSDLQSNFNLEIYNSANQLVGSSALSGSQSEKINLNTNLEEFYSVRVFGPFNATSAQCYVLSITTGAAQFSRVEEMTAEETEESAPLSGMRIYPNPVVAGSTADLSFPNATSELCLVKVLSIDGSVVKEEILSLQAGRGTIHLNEVMPGMYLVDAGIHGKTKLLVK